MPVFCTSNQQLQNYVCTLHRKEYPEDEHGLIMVEERIFDKRFFRYQLKGMVKDDLDVQVKKDELIVFD